MAFLKNIITAVVAFAAFNMDHVEARNIQRMMPSKYIEAVTEGNAGVIQDQIFLLREQEGSQKLKLTWSAIFSSLGFGMCYYIITACPRPSNDKDLLFCRGVLSCLTFTGLVGTVSTMYYQMQVFDTAAQITEAEGYLSHMTL